MKKKNEFFFSRHHMVWLKGGISLFSSRVLLRKGILLKNKLLLCTILTGVLLVGKLTAQNVSVDTVVIANDPGGDTIIMANQYIEAINTVGSLDTVIYRSGEKILLKDGFLARENSLFFAQSDIAFTATQAISDAYIDLQWKISLDHLPHLTDLNGEVYLQILDITTGEEVYVEEIYIHHIRENGKTEGIYRHYAGAGRTISYQLNLYLEGDGTLLRDALVFTGKTDGFRVPNVSVSSDQTVDNYYVDKIRVDLENHSDLIAEYKIYRIENSDTVYVGSLDTFEEVYEDKYAFTGGNSIVNGVDYSYIIRPYSDRFQRFYSAIQVAGNTYPVNPQATDSMYTDKVVITWDNVSTYADAVKVTRDGDFLMNLPANATSYTDVRPIFGKKHQYAVVLIKNNEEIVAAYDEGSVQTNGLISGRVVSREQDIAMAGVTIEAVAVIEGDSIVYTALSDQTGYYEFEDLYYGEKATFSLQASFNGHTFTNNPRLIALSRQDHQFTNIDFKDEVQFEIGNGAFAFGNLQLIPKTTEDHVQLLWDYTPPLTGEDTFFKIYRKELQAPDSTLIALIANQGQYLDLTGIPSTTYIYTVAAYVQQEDTISTIVSSDTIVYPQVATIASSSIIVNTNLGTVGFSWSHTSDNFTGFRIYREGELIATLSSADTAYTDLDGMPGVQHEYMLTAYIERKGQMYESGAVISVVDYPILPVASGIVATALPDQDALQLQWNFPVVSSAYNYDGVAVYRNGELVEKVHKGFDAQWLDRTGVPNVSYDYSIRVYKDNREWMDQSEAVITHSVYPIIKAPSNFQAFDGVDVGYVRLQWEHTSENHDGFLVLRDNDTLATLPAGIRNYEDVVPTATTSAQYTYTVKAFRQVEGNKYYSTAVTDTGSASGDGGMAFPQAPTHFTASDGLARHILLAWEYPEYLLAEFIVLRDGIVLDTLNTDDRVYYDYNAEKDKTHVYQVRAMYEGSNSYLTGDRGSLGSDHFLSGMVVTQSEGFGVAGVIIKATTQTSEHTFYQTVITDSSGFYRFDHIPEKTGTIIEVSASLQNHIFEQDTFYVAIEENTNAYFVNFVDEVSHQYHASDSAALPVDVIATPDLVKQQVTIRWNVNSENYSGFKVFRGLKEIANISAQHPRVVIDSTGFPGYDYAYRVQTYWDVQGGRENSGFVTGYTTYPIISPVEHVQLIQLEEEDKIQISWSHPSDKHDYYEIKRGGDVIGMVPTEHLFLFNDTTGIPGYLYNYTITAVKNTSQGLFTALPVSGQVEYPYVSPVTGLQASTPNDQNYITLDWGHKSGHFDGYYIERDGVVIDTLDKTARTYIDREGVPGQVQEYRVITFVAKNNLLYESVPVKIVWNYPKIKPVGNLQITPDSLLGNITLRWDYTPEDTEGYNIYRDDILIATISGRENRFYNDITGIPQIAYVYDVRAFDIRDEQQHESDEVTANINYPGVPVPTSVTASDSGFINHITVNWEYQAISNDGFYIYKDGIRVDTVDAGRRSFRQVFNQTTSGSYTVMAFRDINGHEYLSDLSDADAGSTGTNMVNTSLTNVTASKGIHLNKVSVSWEFTGTNDTNVQIYRDSEHLATIPAINKVYQDIDGIPGKAYVYSIKLAPNDSKADIGYRKANGTIKGTAITQQDGIGVPGVVIKAFTSIEGERYVFMDTTDTKGEYEIPEVYYGRVATYTVTAAYPGHSFVQDTLETDLGQQVTTGSVSPFIDKTAYLIKGNVHRVQASCGVDSVRVVLKTIRDGQELVEETFTNTLGNYTFTVNPQDREVTQYQVSIDRLKTYFEKGQRDTTYFQFVDPEVTFSRSRIDNFSLVNKVDFVDTTTYPVTLAVQNACGPIGANRFDIRVSSTDGCFMETYRTLDNGKVTVDLPPLTYEMVVSGVETPNPQTLAVVDYLRVRPVHLSLFDSIHHPIESGVDVLDSLENQLTLAFTFHKAPKITVSGLADYLCGDPEMPAIVAQGDTYTLNLNVFEEHEGRCPVNEGFLIIKNAADDNTAPVRLNYDQQRGGFRDYTFTAGEPITIAPYTLGLVIEYHTENGGYQGEKIQSIIVEGEKSPPGNDIIVSLDRNTMQLPLFVLRDPPGDQSYSYVEAGKTFEKALTVSDMNSGGVGLKLELANAIGGLGNFGEYSFAFGGGNGESAFFNVSITTTQRIETTSDSKLTNNYVSGEQADVIVGTGLSTAYGITEKIEIDPNGCEIIKGMSVQLLPNGLSTDWHYSVFQIEKLVEEYDQQLQGLNAGTFSIDGMTTEEAKAYITVLKNNWKEILRYHKIETVPMCKACDLDNLPGPFKSAVKDMEAYNSFCGQIRVSGTCNLDNFIWTNDLMNQYNRFNIFKNDLEDYIAYRYAYNDGGAIQFNRGEEALIITNTILNNVDLNGEYQQLYGPEVKNITFDGAAGAISNEVTVAKSQSRGLVQHTYVNSDNYLGLFTQARVIISKGLGLSVELAPEVEVEQKIGFTVSYNFEFEKVKENTSETIATVGYVLDDDDDGDQFSVTVVRGIDPSYTPYFSVLGGRSSAPYEEGTIARFDPQLWVVLPDGSLTKEAELWDVDPEGPASFQLMMASGNPFGEGLIHYLYVPTGDAPNQNDAEIFLQVGGENDGTGTRAIYPDEPQYTQVDIFRREGDVYDYTDIELALAAKAEEDYNTIEDKVTLKVHFRRPCSPVSIVADGNRDPFGNGTQDGSRWVINKAPQGEREQLFVKLVDYAPESVPLEYVTLQYRRLGSNNWFDIERIEKDSLATYYTENILTYPNPTYPYVWDITGLDLADGEYEVRVMAFCGTSGKNYSNVLSGIIDRTSLQVFGNPEPSDGVLSPGEDIMVTFNETIDCALFDPTSVTLANISNGGNVAVNASAACSGNQLALVVDHATLAALDGDTLQVTMASALDVYGNELENPVTWQFTVHYEPVYWLPNSLEVDVFKGESTTLTAQLFNSSGIHQEFLLSGYEGLNWLTVSETNGTVLPSGKPIDLGIDTKMLDVGSYTQTLTAAITGYQDETFALTVNVLPERPDWEVDLGQHVDNATVIANFNLDDTGLSVDTLDLISVWMGNSLRGVSNISKVSEGSYVAYLTVSGGPADAGEVLSFRVWDASTGTEYDAHLGQTYTYSKDVHYGTTASPVVLIVNSSADAPNYVPLRSGWNWFSVNTSPIDMSVDNVFKSLNPMEGDQLKTLNSTSSYSDTLGWESLDGLDSISTNQGYLLYLAKADTLRLAGVEAVPQNISLLTGWNLIGYPLQEVLSVNEALIISNLTDGDVLKGDRSLAEYNASLWNGMDRLQPYRSYMIYMGQSGSLFYNTPPSSGTLINRDKDELGVNPGTATGEVALSMARSASDWSVDPTDYEYNMTFTGAIALKEGQEVYPGNKVVAFVGEECRGIGELVYIESLNRYETSLFVYANTEGEEVTFRIVDEEIAKVYGTVNKEVFVANTHHGSFTEPYLFQGGEVLSSSIVLMAHPNPFEEEVTVKFNTEGSGPHHWVLRDEVGALILSGEVEAVRGMNILVLDLGRELPSGVYLLSLTGPTTHETIKLMKH